MSREREEIFVVSFQRLFLSENPGFSRSELLITEAEFPIVESETIIEES